MVAVKSYQADAFLKRLDPRITAILVYGTDEGMVAERARIAAQSIAARDNPPGEILRIGDVDLEDNPDRLAVELLTLPMFGGRKVVRAATGRRVNAQSLRPLLEEELRAGALVIEAGSLRRDDALLTLFEKSDAGAAIACHGDEARDIAGVVSDVLGAAGLTITTEARELLVARLGADRALTRAEVEKLALFAHGRTSVEAGDIEALVGDASELAIDRIIFAAAGGQAASAVAECDRAVSAGESPQLVILSLQRHFQRIDRLRAQVDAGRSFDEATRSLRPPLHFKHKDALAAQVRGWSPARLREAHGRIARAALAARLNADLEHAITERLLLEIAMLGRQDAGRAASPRG